MPHAAKVQRPEQQPALSPAVSEASEPEPAARRAVGATSADLRTMSYEEGAACLAPKDAAPEVAPKAARELTKEEEYRREDAFDAITAIHGGLLDGRAAELERVADQSASKDAPPWWQEAAIVAGSVALTSATAGLGAAVFAGAAAAAQSSGLSTAIAQAAASGLKGAAKSFLGAAIREGAKAPREPKADSAAQFFQMQEDAIRNTAHHQQIEFIEQMRPAIRAAPNSVAQAEAIARGMATIKPSQAGLIQRTASVDAWCRYQAKASLESESDASDGPADMPAMLEEPDVAGVLELTVVANAPGSGAHVQSAKIAGLNERLRSDLTGRSIGSLRIPMVVSAIVHHGASHPAADGARSPARDPGCLHVRLSRDEAGSVLLSGNPGPAQSWFARRGGAEGASAETPTRSDLAASIRGAAAFVHEDIEPQLLTARVME